VGRICALLSESPALINQYSPDGFPALNYAAFFGQVEVLKLLLEQGANPNLAAQNQMRVTALHSAAAHGNGEIAAAMSKALVEAGANVNLTQQGDWTPLHEAADNNYIELVKLLLAHGADKHAKSDDGRTPLDMAAAHPFEEVVAVLQHG